MAVLPKTIQKIKDAARDTGVKDALAQPVIDRLLDLGRSLRKQAKGVNRQPTLDINELLSRELQQARNHCVNPLLSMDGKRICCIYATNSNICCTGVDIHRDTPTEILHTVLLGVVKYFWGQSVFVLDKAKKLMEFERRLASANIAGLNLPQIDAQYMRQHRGSLIGKHFKAIVQLMNFLCYDLLPEPVQEAWFLLGRLCSLLWYTSIDDIKTYMVSHLLS
jgi:hypothetical protein